LIVDWWDLLVCSSAHLKLATPLIRSLIDHAEGYAFESPVKPDHVSAWQNWLEDMLEGRTTELEYSGKFAYSLTWMPGNLVRGPPSGHRTHDPSNSFDHKVSWQRGCLPGKKDKSVQPLLETTYDAMREYCQDGMRDTERVTKAVESLAKIASIEGDASPFREDQWSHTSKPRTWKKRNEPQHEWTALGKKSRELYFRDAVAYCNHFGSVFATEPSHVSGQFKGNFVRTRTEVDETRDEREQEETGVCFDGLDG